MTLLPILITPILLVGASVQQAPEPLRAETGQASWYGRAHHGRRTASGELFDMHALTAAHRTLPFGTIVQVTDLRTGRSVKVRINDRGAFRRGRVIDLSYEAARKLGFIRRGTTRVEITVIGRGGPRVRSANTPTPGRGKGTAVWPNRRCTLGCMNHRLGDGNLPVTRPYQGRGDSR